jgi:hypothetical protein
VTNATPDSYTFWFAEEYQALGNGKAGISNPMKMPFPDFTFINRHLYRVRLMALAPGNLLKEQMAIYFEKPVESNGFWYPTIFRMTPAPTPWPYPQMSWGLFVPMSLASAGQLRITLSDVFLKVK